MTKALATLIGLIPEDSQGLPARLSTAGSILHLFAELTPRHGVAVYGPATGGGSSALCSL
jgi:hypothetical protein